MSSRKMLKFPVIKKSTRLASKRKGTDEKMYNEEFDEHSVTVCKENKKMKLNENIDYLSSIEDEMQNVIDGLRTFSNDEFVERDEQIKIIRYHLDKCLSNRESPSLYLCGPAGTGKTAVAEFLQSQKDIQNKFTVVYVHCVRHQSNCTDVYREIQQKLGGNSKMERNVKDNVDKLINTLTSQKKPVLLILDEVLKLNTKNQAVLHSLMKLPSRLCTGQIALITIGNLLNYTERFLSRLKSNVFKKPVMVEFLPYSDQEIVDIVKKRLNKIHLEKITIEEPSIQLLGRKAAANRHDASYALEVTEKIIKACIAENTKDEVCAIRPFDVQMVMTRILEEKDKFDRLNHLSLHEKLIVCAVLVLIGDKRFDRTKLDLHKIEDMYMKICEKYKISHSDKFMNLCSLIECTGVFRISGKKQDRRSKVSLEWHEDEIRSRLSDKCLFGTILSS